jgi:GNAT superfamily N-acetyltransferase
VRADRSRPARPRFRRARPSDVPRLLAFMRALYAHDRLTFRPRVARAALDGLLRAPRFGRIYVIEHGGRPIGYAVLTLSWSLEYRGADAFIDEIYLDPAFRGRGLGRLAIEHLAARCRAFGVGALHLEVERPNLRAQEIYRRAGFVDHDRFLMTRTLRAQGSAAARTAGSR